jgi:hypothetical protein
MKKSNKRSLPSSSSDPGPKAQRNDSAFHGNKASLLPQIPKVLETVATRKYRFEEREAMMTHTQQIHELIILHNVFWKEIFKIKNLCDDHILYLNSKRTSTIPPHPRIYRLVYITIKMKELLKDGLKQYNAWRWADGCFIGSPSMVKCCAGHAHGWTAIDRIYIMEANIFFHLNYHTKKKMLDKEQLTRKEIAALIHKDRRLLVHVETPIHQWSSRMIMLQMRLISQRWNHLKNIVSDTHFRSGLWKLLMQIQYRSYVLIHYGIFSPELQTAASIVDEGVLSAKFTGKIICTPETNCGMSSIVSKGSWLDNLILTCSKIITKLQNCLVMMNMLCPMKAHRTIDQMITRSEAFRHYHSMHLHMSTMLEDKTCELLNSGQIQEQLASSLCVSLIGIDLMVRRTDVFGMANDDDNNYHAKSRNVAPTGMCLWLDSFLKSQKKEFILESDLAKELIDMREISTLYAFEIISKKEGNNDMGFIHKFFTRLENVRDDGDIVINDLSQTKTPYILKVGATYIVAVGGQDTNIHCDTIVEAVVVWALIFQHYNEWKSGKNNFSSIYDPIFNI